MILQLFFYFFRDPIVYWRQHHCGWQTRLGTSQAPCPWRCSGFCHTFASSLARRRIRMSRNHACRSERKADRRRCLDNDMLILLNMLLKRLKMQQCSFTGRWTKTYIFGTKTQSLLKLYRFAHIDINIFRHYVTCLSASCQKRLSSQCWTWLKGLFNHPVTRLKCLFWNLSR